MAALKAPEAAQRAIAKLSENSPVSRLVLRSVENPSIIAHTCSGTTSLSCPTKRKKVSCSGLNNPIAVSTAKIAGNSASILLYAISDAKPGSRCWAAFCAVWRIVAGRMWLKNRMNVGTLAITLCFITSVCHRRHPNLCSVVSNRLIELR